MKKSLGSLLRITPDAPCMGVIGGKSCVGSRTQSFLLYLELIKDPVHCTEVSVWFQATLASIDVGFDKLGCALSGSGEKTSDGDESGFTLFIAGLQAKK